MNKPKFNVGDRIKITPHLREVYGKSFGDNDSAVIVGVRPSIYSDEVFVYSINIKKENGNFIAIDEWNIELYTETPKTDANKELLKKIREKFLFYYDLDDNGNPTKPKDDDFGQIDSIACECLDAIWKIIKDV